MQTGSSRCRCFLSALSLSLAIVSLVQAGHCSVSRTNTLCIAVDGAEKNGADRNETGRQQIVVLKGPVLLYYLYERCNSLHNPINSPIYRSRGNNKGVNAGAIYYRRSDANHTVVWLRAGSRGVPVSLNSVLRYLPDFKNNHDDEQYKGLVDTHPRPLAHGRIRTAYRYAMAHGLSSKTAAHVSRRKRQTNRHGL